LQAIWFGVWHSRSGLTSLSLSFQLTFVFFLSLWPPRHNFSLSSDDEIGDDDEPQPSHPPSPLPTTKPSAVPTSTPTPAPSSTFAPTTGTGEPSQLPTPKPTAVPTYTPTGLPTLSLLPSPQPTAQPTHVPSPVPTIACGNGTYLSDLTHQCEICGIGKEEEED
jgi:hypothetical protein